MLTVQKFKMLSLVVLVLVLLGAAAVYTPQGLANHLQCSDGIDNDNDGKADFPQDPQCSGTEDPSESEGNSSSSIASISSSSASSAGLILAVSDGKNTIRAGDSMIYVITLTQNTEASKVVDVNLFLTPYANVVSPDQGGTVSGGNQVKWNRITLVQNQQQRLTVQMGINPNTPENTQLVARVTAGGAEASDSTVVQNSPQTQDPFKVFVTDDRQTVAPNDTLNYRATVKNDAAVARTIDVILMVSPFVTISNLQPTANTDSNTIVWKDVTFNPGETKNYTFRALVRRNAQEFVSVNTLIKAGSATAADSTSVQTHPLGSSSSSRSSTSSITSRRAGAPTRSVLFSKSADTDEVVSGGRVRYTLFVQNVLLTTINDATITDRFDSSILSVADAGNGTVVSPGQLQWKLPRLLPGQTWTQSYTLSVGAIAEGTQLSNVATITGNDVATATLDEKVVVIKTGVVNRLPSTGGAYDVLFLLATAPLAGVTALLQKRRRA